MAKRKTEQIRVTIGQHRAVSHLLSAETEARIRFARRVTLAEEAASGDADRMERLERELIEAKGLPTSALQVLDRPSVLGNAIWLFLRFLPERRPLTAVQTALKPESVVDGVVEE